MRGVGPAGVLQRRPVSPINNRAFPFKSRAKVAAGPPPAVAVILTQRRRHDHGKTPRVHACRRRRRARQDPPQPDRQADRNFKFTALRWAIVAMTAGQIGNGSEDADCGRRRRARRDDGRRLPAARGFFSHHLRAGARLLPHRCRHHPQRQCHEGASPPRPRADGRGDRDQGELLCQPRLGHRRHHVQDRFRRREARPGSAVPMPTSTAATCTRCWRRAWRPARSRSIIGWSRSTRPRDAIRLVFENGAAVDADIVIGADGVNSKVREYLLGSEPPRYVGMAAHRAIFPTTALRGFRNSGLHQVVGPGPAYPRLFHDQPARRGLRHRRRASRPI